MNAKINTTHTLTLDAAHELLAQARSACAQRGFAATIAITDAGGICAPSSGPTPRRS